VQGEEGGEAGFGAAIEGKNGRANVAKKKKSSAPF